MFKLRPRRTQSATGQFQDGHSLRGKGGRIGTAIGMLLGGVLLFTAVNGDSSFTQDITAASYDSQACASASAPQDCLTWEETSANEACFWCGWLSDWWSSNRNPTATPTRAPATSTPTRTPTKAAATSTPTQAAATAIPTATATSPATNNPAPPAGSLVVGSGGYSTIQAAVNAASSGQTIAVRAGTYREQVNVNKSVTITAYGDGAVTINGDCSRKFGVNIQANNVKVSGIGVTNTTEASVTVGKFTNATVERATLTNWNCASGGSDQFRAGVSCWYCSGLTVTDSRIETSRKNGNGIWLKSNGSNPSTGGHTIARNTIIGGFDGIGSEAENDSMGGFVKNTVIEGNTIQNCDDDGIQVEGRNENVRVRNNKISGCGLGIALAPNMVGPLYIENNTITGLQPRFYGLQACFKLGDGGSGTAYITGNTCKSNGDGFKQTNSGMTKIVASDNCIVVSRYVIELSGAPASGTSFNGNTLYTSDSGRFVKWNGSTYLDLAKFRSATGQEANGVQSSNC